MGEGGQAKAREGKETDIIFIVDETEIDLEIKIEVETEREEIVYFSNSILQINCSNYI